MKTKNKSVVVAEPAVVIEATETIEETFVEPVAELAIELAFEEPVIEVVTEVVEEPVAQLPAPLAIVITLPTVDEVEQYINELGVTTSYKVYTTAAQLNLIAKQWLKDGTNFFERSYGARAGKKHLRDWAPKISLRTFIEIGLSYHASKQVVSETTKRAWQPYPNYLSYALLGMAVMTEREPAMSTGVYSNIGPSFKKHQQAAWTQWFHDNSLFNTVKTEITAIPVVVEPAVETSLQRDVETVETIAAELVEVVAKAKRGSRKNQEQAAA
jgi:hypothetical protein